MPALCKQVGDRVTFFAQFGVARIHTCSAEWTDFQALNNLVLPLRATTGIGVNDPGLDAIATIGRNRHADPIIPGGSQSPVTYVIYRG